MGCRRSFGQAVGGVSGAADLVHLCLCRQVRARSDLSGGGDFQRGAGGSFGAVVATRWPGRGTTRPRGLNLIQSFAEIARPAILLRMGLLGGVLSIGTLYMMLVSLIFQANPRPVGGDVALYVGMVAGWRCPSCWPCRGWPGGSGGPHNAVGAAIYTGHLALMPVPVGHWSLWLLPLLAGMGAAILTLPIGYYQDLTGSGTGGRTARRRRCSRCKSWSAMFVLPRFSRWVWLLAVMAQRRWIGFAVTLVASLGLYLADRRGDVGFALPVRRVQP